MIHLDTRRELIALGAALAEARSATLHRLVGSDGGAQIWRASDGLHWRVWTDDAGRRRAELVTEREVGHGR